MINRTMFLAGPICLLLLLTASAFAQTTERTNGSSSAANDAITNEIAQLRKVLQILNTNLRDITEKLLAPETKQQDDPRQRSVRISTNLELLSRVEQRAEILRKQLFELTEKETYYKIRLTQLDEDLRPENIERALASIGTTRTVEMRDTRRRVLENEKRGVQSLLTQMTPSRIRLEDDVTEADQMVLKLRQRLFPLIEKEIEKISPEPE